MYKCLIYTGFLCRLRSAVVKLMRMKIHESCTTVILAEIEGATGAAVASVVFCQ